MELGGVAVLVGEIARGENLSRDLLDQLGGRFRSRERRAAASDIAGANECKRLIFIALIIVLTVRPVWGLVGWSVSLPVRRSNREESTRSQPRNPQKIAQKRVPIHPRLLIQSAKQPITAHRCRGGPGDLWTVL